MSSSLWPTVGYTPRSMGSRVLAALPRMVLGIALAVCLAGVAAAQPGEKDIAGDLSLGLDRHATTNLIPALDVQEMNLIDVTHYIEETANVNVLVSPNLKDKKITLQLQKPLTWLDTLRVIADEADADLRMITEDTVRLVQPPKVALEFREAPVKDAIALIARVSGQNIVIPSNIEEVNQPITMNLRDVPWDDALDVVVKAAGLVVVSESGGRVVRIAHPNDLKKQLQTQIFQLRYIRPRGEYNAIFAAGSGIGTGGGTGGGGSRTFVERNRRQAVGELADRFPLLGALQKALTVDDMDQLIGKMDYDEITNTLIVKDQATNLEDIGNIIQQIDVEPGQVQIDLQFVQTLNNDLLDFGVDIFSDGLQVTGSMGSFIHRLPFNMGEGGWEGSLEVGRNPGPMYIDFDQPTEVPENITDMGYTFGTLDFTGVNAALRILKRDVNTRIVQAPKVVALDGRPATIFVGDEVRFAESEAVINDVGVPTVTIQEAEDSPVQVGFQVLVVPFIIRGTNKIKLTVIPANTALTGPFNGFDIFRVADAELQLPRLTSATVVTHMIVQNGQTAVIGGIKQENDSITTDKVPLLGDIPGIGYAFKNRVTNSQQSTLIVFITPRIVQDFESTEGYLSRYIEQRAERLSAEVEELTGEHYIPPAPEEEEEDSMAPAAE